MPTSSLMVADSENTSSNCFCVRSKGSTIDVHLSPSVRLRLMLVLNMLSARACEGSASSSSTDS